MHPPVILVQHPHDLRHGLPELRGALPHFTAIGTQAAAEEVLAHCRTANWDIVLLDFSDRTEKSIEVVKRLRRERPDMRLIIKSGVLDPAHIRRCLGLGIRGYLAALDGPAEIGNAVRAVWIGAVYLSRSAAQGLIDQAYVDQR
jgi:DNA-binding NarL/FixJ family response regulator